MRSLQCWFGKSGYTIVMLTLKEIVYGWNRPWSWGGELNEKSHISFLVSQNSSILRGGPVVTCSVYISAT